MKVNFKEFKIKKSFKGDEYVTNDFRESFADLIYTATNGIRGLKLAEKIYASDGPVELDEQETMILSQLVETQCTPQIIDAFGALRT